MKPLLLQQLSRSSRKQQPCPLLCGWLPPHWFPVPLTLPTFQAHCAGSGGVMRLQGARLHGWPAAELCQCHHRPWDDGNPKLSPLPRVCVVLLWMCCAAACSLPHCVSGVCSAAGVGVASCAGYVLEHTL